VSTSRMSVRGMRAGSPASGHRAQRDGLGPVDATTYSLRRNNGQSGTGGIVLPRDASWQLSPDRLTHARVPQLVLAACLALATPGSELGESCWNGLMS
jgi:hypothetical protein